MRFGVPLSGKEVMACVAAALGIVWFSCGGCEAKAQAAPTVDYRSLGMVDGYATGFFDHGPNRCYLYRNGISCVQRKP